METDRYLETSWMRRLLAKLKADDTREPQEKFRKFCDVFKAEAAEPVTACTSPMSLWSMLRRMLLLMHFSCSQRMLGLTRSPGFLVSELTI
jgi:hypothetical protein